MHTNRMKYQNKKDEGSKMLGFWLPCFKMNSWLMRTKNLPY